MTPCENLRRFVVGSPPWIIFMLSLGVMAVGVLVLAYRLRVDPDYGREHALKSLPLCYSPKEQSSAPQKLPTLPQFNVSVPVTLRVSQSFSVLTNKSSDLFLVGSGQMYSGQMGLKGSSGHSHNWTFVVFLSKLISVPCPEEKCEEDLFHTCMVLFADDFSTLPSIVTEESCAANFSAVIHDSSAKNSLSVLELTNRRDEYVNKVTSSSNLGTEKIRGETTTTAQFCSKGIPLRMHLDEREHFVLIPLVHDTMAARLHLLYTSYFLFTTLIVLLCYAMCKGHSFHNKSSRTLTGELLMEDISCGKNVS